MANDGRNEWNSAGRDAVPGCALGPMAVCGGRSCDGCGWNEDEIARRKTRIEHNGLTPDPATGLLRLVIPARG